MTIAHEKTEAAKSALKAGFADPIVGAHDVFRSSMQAIAYAGRPVRMEYPVSGPRPLDPATAAIGLALMDFETPVWLQTYSDDAAAWLRFHCGVSIAAEPTDAAFAVITDPTNMPAISVFKQGEIEYPEASTTLIIQVPSLVDGPRTTWTGPGIDGSIDLSIAGLPSWFWSLWDLNRELYPRGVDVIFTRGDTMIGMPRTINVDFDNGSVE